MLLADNIIQPLGPEAIGQRSGSLGFEQPGQGCNPPPV